MEVTDSTAMIPLDDLTTGDGDGDDGGKHSNTTTNTTTTTTNTTIPTTTIPATTIPMYTNNNGNGCHYSDERPTRMLNITRRVYTRDELDETYPVCSDEPFSLKSYLRGKCRCSIPRAQKLFLSYFPIVGVLYNYQWRSDLLTDFVAGISVAFLHVPQGLALGLLASLPPVYGLYATFFPIVFYMLFGTSRHTSMGTNALISLLIAGIIDTQLKSRTAATEMSTSTHVSPTTQSITSDATVTFHGDGLTTDAVLQSSSSVDSELLAFKVGVASSVGLLSGLYLTVAGLLKLGAVTRYFSSAFLGGFTTAVAVHIIVSQLSKLINVRIGVHSGAGKLVKIVLDVFQKVGDANPADVVISLISVPFLLLVTIFINERYKDKLKVPVPVQLILVTVSTIISHFANLESQFGVAVVGDVPSGIPSPVLPNIGAYPGIAYEAIVVAILTFTISISLGKLTAKVHNYDIDDNQEFIAYGLTNTLSSFFSCYTSCNNPPRAMVLSGVGARSTIHAVFSAILILIVLLAAGPLFQALPVAVLAAMICSALKNILLQVTQLPFIWRTNKPDFIVWVLTCLISIFIDLDIGIVAGIFISFLTIIVKNQLASGTLGELSNSEDLIHLDGNRRSGAKSPDDRVAIFYYPSQLYFANSEKFKKDLFSKTFNPREIESKNNNYALNENNEEEEETRTIRDKKDSHLLLKYIILDCSAITYIDMDGANMLKTVSALYLNADTKLLLTNCCDGLLHRIESVGYFEDISRDTIFFDVYDAVSFVREVKETS